MRRRMEKISALICAECACTGAVAAATADRWAESIRFVRTRARSLARADYRGLMAHETAHTIQHGAIAVSVSAAAPLRARKRSAPGHHRVVNGQRFAVAAAPSDLACQGIGSISRPPRLDRPKATPPGLPHVHHHFWAEPII